MNSFRSYVEDAGSRRSIWRVLLGVLIIVVCWFVLQMVVIGSFVAWEARRVGDLQQALESIQVLERGGAPWIIALTLSTFIGIWPGVFLAAKVLHFQELGTLFQPRLGRGGPRLFLMGFVLAIVFAGASTVAGLFVTDVTRTDLPVSTWLLWLVPLAVLVFLQAVGEEMIFRAYLLQQLARLSRNPFVWAVLPALTFGLAHLANAPLAEGGIYYVLVTAISGVALAVLVWRSGCIWPAAGLHFGINMTAITVIGSEGLLAGAQLFSVPKTDFMPLIQIDAASSVLLLAFVLSPLGRIFGDGGPDEAAEAVVFD